MPNITMPKLSDTMTEGTIARWKKKKGDTVKFGDVLAEVETDKATMEMEAFDDLDAPVGRVCSLDAPAIYSPALEPLQLPTVDRILRKVKEIC